MPPYVRVVLESTWRKAPRQSPARQQAEAVAGRDARNAHLAEAAEELPLPLGAYADPRVADLEAVHAPPARGLLPGRHRRVDAAGRRELDAVGEEVEQDLPEALRVADHGGVHRGVHVDAQLQPLLRRAVREEVGRLLDGGAQVEGDGGELQLARLHLGQVQDVVDEAQEGVGRGADLAHEGALLGGERGVGDQLRQAQHRVERRAHLVRHGGEELGLGLVGRLHLRTPGRRAG